MLMDSSVKTKQMRIGGMTCLSCQNKIERKLCSTAGVKHAKVNYSERTADITFDAEMISLKDIYGIIEELDYSIEADNARQGMGCFLSLD